VLLEVAAAGLNHADLLQLRGHYPPPAGEPEVPGLECAGRVLALGAGVEGWREGDRVMALLGGGGLATRVAAPAGQLMAVPEALSLVEAAAIPEAGLTAWTHMVVEGGLQAGETVLVTGATGGMGTFAVQLARELGAHVLASARGGARLARLVEMGIEGLVPEGSDLTRRLREASGGRGVDVVLDFVGGTAVADRLAALRTGGRLVVVGLLAGSRADLELDLLLRRRLRVIGTVLRARPRAEKARLVADFGAFALPRLANGRLVAVVDRVVPFAQVAEAFQAFTRGGLFGKIVLDMAGAA
jgi:putative PIG3 family NAD(P)H quinone oxidoreductase